jgi:transposase
MAKVDTRTLSPAELEAVRRRGVALVESGMSLAAAAREVGVRAATMTSWMQRHRAGGSSGLVDHRRGRPRVALTVREEARLRRLIEGKTPGQLRMDFALWTTDAVLRLISDRCRKTVSKRTVHRLLGSWGFTPKKGTRRAWQQDAVAVARWVQTDYPEIAKRAKQEQARIFWGDETGLILPRFCGPRDKRETADRISTHDHHFFQTGPIEASTGLHQRVQAAGGRPGQAAGDDVPEGSDQP